MGLSWVIPITLNNTLNYNIK